MAPFSSYLYFIVFFFLKIHGYTSVKAKANPHLAMIIDEQRSKDRPPELGTGMLPLCLHNAEIMSYDYMFACSHMRFQTNSTSFIGAYLLCGDTQLLEKCIGVRLPA